MQTAFPSDSSDFLFAEVSMHWHGEMKTIHFFLRDTGVLCLRKATCVRKLEPHDEDDDDDDDDDDANRDYCNDERNDDDEYDDDKYDDEKDDEDDDDFPRECVPQHSCNVPL